MIPIACAFWALYWISWRRLLRSFAGKILILGLAMILVVPTGTHISEVVCAKYMTYVEETITAAETVTDIESKLAKLPEWLKKEKICHDGFPAGI